MTTSQPLLLAGLGLWVFASASLAQVAINTDGADPDASAMLDVTSNGKGLLIPRLTNAERDGITTPATGLMIYSTTDESFYYYDGTQWQPVGKAGDNDATNELQTISLDSDADRVRLSNGGSALMTKYLDNTDTQDLSLVDDTLSLTDGGSVDLSPYMDNTDTDDQQLSLNANTLSLTDGGSVNLSPYLDNTDAQQLSLSNDTLSLTNGGSVDLSSYSGGRGSLTTLSQTLGTDHHWISGDGDPDQGLYMFDGGAAFIGEHTDAQEFPNSPPHNEGTLTIEGSLAMIESDAGQSATGTLHEVTIGISELVAPDDGLGILGEYGADFSTDMQSFRFGFGSGNGFSVPSLVMDRDAGFSLLLPASFAGSTTFGSPATFNNSVTINTGNPGVGDVWTSTGNNGEGQWAPAATVFSDLGLRATNFYSDNNGTTGSSESDIGDDGTRVDAGTSGFREVTEGTATANLSNGDTVLVMASFRVYVDGGSGSDRYAFQIRADGGISGQVTDTTGALDDLRDHRNKWQNVSFHRTMTINSAPSGAIRFRLRVYMGNADDDLRIDNLKITVIQI